MRPIGKHIIIRTIDEEITTKSGILLSAEDTEQLRYKRGFVVKAGSDVSVISEGDEIYYDKRAGYSMIIGNESYTVIVEKDVVVVL
jgi:co-chaperonin GroES (HSP10)